MPARVLTISDSVVVPAAPDAVYDAVSDVRQMGRWSPENTGAVVAPSGPDDSGPVAVGTVFVGDNRRGRATWRTRCVVTHADRGRRFAFDVRAWGRGNALVPVRIASWEYTMEPHPDGTLVTETWTDDRTRWPDWLVRRVDPLLTGGQQFADFQRRNVRRTLDALRRELATS